MRKFILITIFFSSVLFSQNQRFETTFTFTDGFYNSQALILGYDPFGTDGLDPQLGEVVVPQVPPEQFGVRFQLPTDTSLYTLKDIRFGCGQPFHYEYLIDLSYSSGYMDVNWEWDWQLMRIEFINPYNGQTFATFEAGFDSSFYEYLYLDKIILGVQYNGPLSWPEYEVTSPNGGETLIGGENYTITWWSNGIVPPDRLEYSTDAGNTWQLITDSLWFTPTSYDWLVPYSTSSSCLIRIGDYPCAYDQSDNYFIITYPVTVENEKNLPTEFSLSQNYPNPFNPITKIKYTIPSVETRHASSLQMVTLKIYDVLGNEVATLVNEEKAAGDYKIEFDGTGLPSGIYFYQLKAVSFIQTKKMVLLK
jgi:hypothetical protein